MFCEKCGSKLTEDSKFCDSCGHKTSDNTVQADSVLSEQNKKASKHNKKVLIIVLVVVIIFSIVEIFSDSSDTSTSNTTNIKPVEQQGGETSEKQKETSSYEKISEAVVNILCPHANEPFDLDSKGTGGSGTIINEKGIIISNSHIIPQNKKTLNISEEGCFITLPDASTGSPKEIYLANPIVMNELSDKYDLAFLSIYDVYTDKDNYKYGQYPREFPVFDDSGICKDENIRLGEGVIILGYPISSGGYNLTITDGIVSSFSDDGLILTSAKIDQGNSGGLAIDKDGCMLGIPSSVSVGKYENLGAIIPSSTLSDFIVEVEKQLN